MASPSRRRKHIASKAGDHGASAVEFALIMPVLVMLVFGIIAFGIVFAQQLSLGNAARQAARFGVVDSRTCTDILSQVEDSATTLAMAGADVTITAGVGTSETAALAAPTCTGGGTTQPCKGSPAGSSLYVRTHYTSELIIPLVVTDNDFDLTGVGVFRCEFS